MHSNTIQSLAPEHIALVQASFARVEPVADMAAALFYERLFELEPQARRLFTGDMHAQRRKLMLMLGTVVNGLHRLPALAPVILALGERHRGYGVTDAHYASVGAALLWTLEQGLGEHWTPELHSAWAHTYAVLSAVMTAAPPDEQLHNHYEVHQ